MSDASCNWSFETYPVETCTCPCCGEPYRTVTGTVHDEGGKDLAGYVAYLKTHSGVKLALLEIQLLATNRNGKKLKKNPVWLEFRMREGMVVTSVVTDPENFPGRGKTRQEALRSPFMSLVFEVADFVVRNDPHIGPFLEVDPARSAP